MLLVGCRGGPVIEKFLASGTRTPLGRTVLLSWSVKGATRLELSDVGEVHGDPVAVRPTATTTFVLTAFGEGGETTQASLTVEVTSGADVRIGTFATGAYQGTVVLARILDDQGRLPRVDSTGYVDLPGGGAPLQISCAAGAEGCFGVFPDVPPASGVYRARFQVVDVQRDESLQPNASVPRPPNVTLQRLNAQTLRVRWDEVPGSVNYQVRAYDLDHQAGIGPTLQVRESSVDLTAPEFSLDTNYAVFVDAMTFDPVHPSPPVTLSPVWVVRGTAYLTGSSGWQLWTPAQYEGDALSLSFEGMGADERLAVLTLNLSRQDHVPARLDVSNVAPLPDLDRLTTSSVSALASPHTEVRRWESAVLPLLSKHQTGLFNGARRKSRRADTGPAEQPFCVREGLRGATVRTLAALVNETDHARFYVDKRDLTDYDAYPSIWDSLGSAWESRIYPRITQTFGAESDVDDNGKLIVLFSNALGGPQNGAVLVGYFYALDVVEEVDITPDCTGTGSNGADMFYMNGIANLLPHGFQQPSPADVDELVNGQYPSTLAHEFQHLINFNQHYFVWGTSGALGEATWINEGLSVTAEDVAGYGWHRPAERSVAALYLNRLQDSLLRYDEASLTRWEQDPVGNYAGVHTYFRLWADQRGDVSLGRIVQTAGVGEGSLERALGLPFEWAFAQWTSGLMFSNEAFSPDPRFNYSGADWTPFHRALASLNEHGQVTRFGYLNATPLGVSGAMTTLRTDGFNAFLTGVPRSAGSPVTVRVTATSAKPHVVVVRFRGDLPSGLP